MTAVRIFVGTPANNEDLECQAVLDYSLRQHATMPLDITWMMLSRDSSSFWYSDPQKDRGWQTRSWATPFSALRWGIPAVCGFEGRAIYMDSDMIAMADIAELWRQPVPSGKAVLMTRDGASCVMMMDCAAMEKHLPSIDILRRVKDAYRQVRGRIAKTAGATFQGNWNCRDGESYKSIFDYDVKVLHYTRIPTQPNHRHARERLKREGRPHWYPGPDQRHPREEVIKLFDDTLAAANAAGRGPETFRVSPEFGEYGR